jgi:hypothetical protein
MMRGKQKRQSRGGARRVRQLKSSDVFGSRWKAAEDMEPYLTFGDDNFPMVECCYSACSNRD